MRARGRSAESGFPDRELDRGSLPLRRIMLINTGSGVTGEQLRHWRRTFIQDKQNKRGLKVVPPSGFCLRSSPFFSSFSPLADRNS